MGLGKRVVKPGMSLALVCASVILSACGGGDKAGSAGAVVPDVVSDLSLAPVSAKIFRFSWSDSEGAEYYQLLENADGSSGFSPVAEAIAPGLQVYDLPVLLLQRENAQYILQACNDAGCSDSNMALPGANYMGARGLLKADHPDQGDLFGNSVALSADGSRMVVGATWEDSNAAAVNGDQTNNDSTQAGAGYVFKADGGNWALEAYLKPFYSRGFESFGDDVAISADGSTIAVGAPRDKDDTSGINQPVPTSTILIGSGQVAVFVLIDGEWVQQAYIKANHPDRDEMFGASVALSSDGNLLVVGAPGEKSSATGVNGDETLTDLVDAGAAYVYRRVDGAWQFEAYVKASNTGGNDRFGSSVTVSGNGQYLAVGATGEASATTTINGEEDDDTAINAGAAYVYQFTDTGWQQTAYLKASNAEADDYFSRALAFNGDGSLLLVSASNDESLAAVINGDESNNGSNVGSVFVFARTENIWTKEAYLKPNDAGSLQYFGRDVALSADGSKAIIGSWGAGDRAYLFTRSAGVWQQEAKEIDPGRGSGNGSDFGYAVSISADGSTVAVGDQSQDEDGTGFNPPASGTPRYDSGAVYLY